MTVSEAGIDRAQTQENLNTDQLTKIMGHQTVHKAPSLNLDDKQTSTKNKSSNTFVDRIGIAEKDSYHPSQGPLVASNSDHIQTLGSKDGVG